MHKEIKAVNDAGDEEIAKKVQAGEVEAFGLLVERYESKIKRYGRKFLAGTNDLEDVVQEIFLKAFRNIQSFDSGKKFSSWLYRIAHNEFVNALKKRGKRPLSFFNIDIFLPRLAIQDNPEDTAAKKEARAMINLCLQKLEPKYREPLVLYYFEELSYKEISDILHVPLNTVGVRLKRGKNIMKSLYQTMSNNYAAA